MTSTTITLQVGDQPELTVTAVHVPKLIDLRRMSRRSISQYGISLVLPSRHHMDFSITEVDPVEGMENVFVARVLIWGMYASFYFNDDLLLARIVMSHGA